MFKGSLIDLKTYVVVVLCFRLFPSYFKILPYIGIIGRISVSHWTWPTESSCVRRGHSLYGRYLERHYFWLWQWISGFALSKLLALLMPLSYASLSLQPSVFGCFETLLGVCRSWASPKYHLPFGDPCNSGYVCVTSTTAFMRVPGPDLWKGLSHPATKT